MVHIAKYSGNNFPKTDVNTILYQQAEKLAGEADYPSQGRLKTLPPKAAQRLLHDLRVHQIELEMQNDELRSAQTELEQERSRYFDLYDLAPVGYCTVNEAGLIQQANLTAATLLGMSRQALISKPISRFINKVDQDIYYQCHRQLTATGRPQACELRLLRNDSAPCWVNLASTYALDVDGAPVLRMALTEITASKVMAAAIQASEAEHHALSQTLQHKNVELEDARAAAEKANLAKSDFLSSMSHELRTPLSAILGFAQLIDAAPQAPTPSQKQRLSQIIQAGWYLLDLINEILDLAQIESGKLPLSLEPIALTAAIQECLAMVEPQAQKYGVSLSFLPGELSYFVHADRIRVKQTFHQPAVQCDQIQPARRQRGRELQRARSRTPAHCDPGHRARLVPGKTRATVPALQPSRPGFEHRKRHRHRSGGVQAPGGINGRRHRRGQHGRPRQCVLDRFESDRWTRRTTSGCPKPCSGRHTLRYVEDHPANLILMDTLDVALKFAQTKACGANYPSFSASVGKHAAADISS